jgi:hypothetical protein
MRTPVGIHPNFKKHIMKALKESRVWESGMEQTGDAQVELGGTSSKANDLKDVRPSWGYASKDTPEFVKGEDPRRKSVVSWEKVRGSLGSSFCGKGGRVACGTKESYGQSFGTGDVIGVEWDTRPADGATLRFFKNFHDQGIAYTDLPKNDLALAVILYVDKQQVTLLCGDTCPFPGPPIEPSPPPEAVCKAVRLACQYVRKQVDQQEKKVREHFLALKTQLKAEEEKQLAELMAMRRLELMLLERQEVQLAAVVPGGQPSDTDGNPMDAVAPCPRCERPLGSNLGCGKCHLVMVEQAQANGSSAPNGLLTHGGLSLTELGQMPRGGLSLAGEGKKISAPCPPEAVVDLVKVDARLKALSQRRAQLVIPSACQVDREAPGQVDQSDRRLQDELDRALMKSQKVGKKLEDKALFLKRSNPVVPTDFVSLPNGTPGGEPNQRVLGVQGL